MKHLASKFFNRANLGVNFLNNPDFSKSSVSPTGWIMILSGGSTVDIENYTLKFNIAVTTKFDRINQQFDSNVWYDQYHTQPASLAINTSYLVEFDYKTVNITTNAKVALVENYSSFTNPVYGPALTPSSTWKRYSAIITTGSNILSCLSVVKPSTTVAGAIIYFDNFSLRKVLK